MVSAAVNAQVSVGISSGLGHYQLKEVRSLQQLVTTSLPVPAKITADFPDYWFYEGHIKLQSNKLIGGLHVNFGSTGGRISYADYSGSYTGDQLLRYYSVLGSVGYRYALSAKRLIVTGSLHAGALMGKMELADQLIIGDLVYNESDTYVHTNAVVEPHIELGKEWKRVELFFNAGYQLTFKAGKAKLKSDKDQSLINTEGDPLQVRFDGYRIAFGIRYRLSSTPLKQ